MDEDRTPGQDAADEAYARLQAADPAADAGLDAAALRAEVARRAGTGAEQDGVAEVVLLTSRRRARWLQVAAVGVGAALVAGAGGYAVGAMGGEDVDLVAAAPPISLSGSVVPEAMDQSSAGAATADMRIAPWSGGRAEFSASGLPDDTGRAHAWGLDAASVFSAETVARVADALGVTGEPTLQYGAWTVGAQDGSGPNVSLQPDGTASLSYYDPTRDPWSCTASAADQPGASETSGEAPVVPEPGVATLDPGLVDPALPSVAPPCDPPAGSAPSGEDAIVAAKGVLDRLGVDTSRMVFMAGEPGAPRAIDVQASWEVDGQQSDLAWNVTLVADGVQAIYGPLAPLVDLGEYPVVGAATAVERLNDPRFGSGYGTVMPFARTEAADGDAGALTDDPTVPPTVRPGDPIAWPVQQVTITEARLGLARVVEPDGAALLVPAYELTDADGSTWSVIAVDEGSLDLAG